MPPEHLGRSSRTAREIAILLVGSDMQGKVFSEQTKAVLLSRHGAGIISQYVLSAEQELILRRLDTDKEAEIRVVGQLGFHGESHTYGVALLDEEVDLWGVDFGSMTDSERSQQCAAPVQLLQGPRDDSTKRPGIGCIPGQRRNRPFLQEVRILNDLEAGY
jgi:hypothetical protein